MGGGFDPGLERVVAAETRLSHVYGEEGRLVVRGCEIEDLVRTRDFEGAAALLWEGLAPGPGAGEVRAAIGRARVHAFALVPAFVAATRGLSSIEAVRAGLAMLSDADPTPPHVLATAALATFAAAHSRAARGLAPVAPDPALGHAADFLRMLHGTPSRDAQVRGLDTYLVTTADHGLNASTFTARVVASTRAGIVSAVVAGLCALKGPLHGGAPGPVLDMLDGIGGEAGIGPWIEAALGRGDRLMGFGHRVYRARDPRADVLKAAVASLRGTAERIAFAEKVEAAVLEALRARHPGRPLETNVEFYTALLLDAVGLPRDMFTTAFGIARVAGWTAHAYEQLATGRLVRPASIYVGPAPAGRAA